MSDDCHHVGLATNDPDRLVRFYTEKLGFEVVSSKMLSVPLMETIFGLSVRCRMTKLRREGAIVEVFASEDIRFAARTKKTAGLNHWGLEVADRAGFVRQLRQRGAEPIEASSGDRSIVFVKDPDGNLIEVYERN